MRTPETSEGRRESIYMFIKKRGLATADAVAEEFKCSRRTASRHLLWLLQEGYIVVALSKPTRFSKHPVNYYSLVERDVYAR
jgi:predicted ArsR family transcriptional regulator